MSRVMLIGYGPLPQPGVMRIAAPALRTRQLLKPIFEAGHSVYLFTLPLPGTEGPESNVAAMAPDNYEGLPYQKFTSRDGAFALKALGEQVKNLQPDAIIGVNTYPAWLAASLPHAVPVWGDLCGYLMAEAQGKCVLDGNDDALADAWSVERAIVRRLDRFSAVSRPQLHAVLGELASVGRLNRHTHNYQFGSYVPHAGYRWREAGAAVAASGPSGSAGAAHSRSGAHDAESHMLRGPIIPNDAFMILWSGGFSTASDSATLVGAMNVLMERYPSVHFVTTGGKLDQHDMRLRRVYEELVEQSEYKDRFHDLGWLSSEKLPLIYREADLGIHVDSSSYETVFGSHQRLASMAAEGMALGGTIGTELSEWLDEGGAFLGAPMGDPVALAEAIEPWIDQPEHLRELGEKARKIIEQDFSYARTTRSLLAWLKEPKLAPDNAARLAMSEGRNTDLTQVAINTLDDDALMLSRHAMRDLKEAHDQVQTLRKDKLRSWILGVK